MQGIEAFLASYGLLAFFLVMLLKEAGVPVPVPSDLIIITAGVQAAAGTFNLIELVFALEVAIVVGSTAQFIVARGPGRRLIQRFGSYVGLTLDRLDAAAESIRRRGPMAVFIGLNLPAARAGVVVAAGLAGLAYRTFAPAMAAGSSVFYGWHIALGYIVGPSALALLEHLQFPLVPALGVLAVLGLVVWLALGGRRGDPTAVDPEVVGRLHAWTEAACPACLALATVQRVRGARGWHKFHGLQSGRPARQRRPRSCKAR